MRMFTGRFSRCAGSEYRMADGTALSIFSTVSEPVIYSAASKEMR